MQDDFSNQQVMIGEIPSIKTIDYQKVHKDHLNVSLIGSAIFWGIVLIGCGIWLVFNTVNYPGWINIVGISFLLLLILLSVFFSVKLYHTMGYALREKDIVFKEGYLWRSVTVVPFNRIQHAEVEQGPFDRLFDLSKIKIYTAGGSSSDLQIPGLRPTESESIKFFILNKTGSDEEE